MRGVKLAVSAMALLALAGCASQVAALAPVGGDNPYGVRAAAIDVLLDQGFTVLIVPTCIQGTDAITCSGTVLDGSTIEVTAPGTGTGSMTVSVGGKVVFEGEVQQVLDQAAGMD